MIQRKDYAECLRYIEKLWEGLTCYRKKDKQLHLGLPHKYICPNRGIFKYDQFYWDTYFTIPGLLKAGKVALARGMVDNLIYLFNRFGIIPMRNRYYNLGTSQIPFLTSMISEVFEYTKDKRWYNNVMKVAEKELLNYWTNKKLVEKHIVYKGLSRYCDHYITHLGAEHESGWDMTSRFKDRCLDYLPVDLNSCLYKYEADLADFYHGQKNYHKSELYRKKANKRRRQINTLFWNREKGFYFDYNYSKKHQSLFYSVAGFYPLWAGLATGQHAKNIVQHSLHLFEYEGGLVNTQATHLDIDIKQHDYPNGWPNQHWIVIKGLLNYGYRQDAERIARKWLDVNKKVFTETGKLWEKYDVVNSKIGVCNPERYPTQPGFAWTNSVFLWLINEFGQ